MRVFEFHFNPTAKEDLIFDSFCFEPENIYEKRLGSLYVAGLIKNATPQYSRFLDNLANVTKTKFYAFTAKSPEHSLRESLKEANKFLENLVKGGDVAWMGNINFAVFSLKDSELNFTKIGDIRILLLRQGDIFDIGKNLEFQEIEPYPLKVFSNIVSGKLTDNDKLLIATKEIFDFITAVPKSQKSAIVSKSILSEINSLDKFTEKNLKETFKKQEIDSKNISGLCLMLDLGALPEKIGKKPIVVEKESEKFSVVKTISQSLVLLKNFLLKIPAIVPKVLSFKKLNIKLPKAIHLPKIPKLNINLRLPFSKTIEQPKEKMELPRPRKDGVSLRASSFGGSIPDGGASRYSAAEMKTRISFNTSSFKNFFSKPYIRNNATLVGVFIFLLILGFLIFKMEGDKKLKEFQVALEKIEEKVSEAESFISTDQKKSFEILKQARQDILPLAQEDNSLKDKALALKDAIENDLLKINKYEKIDSPSLFFEFDSKEFIPQKMILLGENIYFYNPYANNIFQINQKGEKNIIKTEQRFSGTVPFGNSIAFFRKPDTIFLLADNQLNESFLLKIPYADFNFNNLVSFQSNLYFLDTKKGEIIKYPYPLNTGKDRPQIWLNAATEKITNAKSLTVDGSIWVLNDDNTIDRYYAGLFQENLKLDLFPFPKNFSKIYIWPALPYLYLLEPSQNRIIILSKQGEIIKQFQSPRFDALVDFAVSGDGKKIYLLNGLKVYQIEF